MNICNRDKYSQQKVHFQLYPTGYDLVVSVPTPGHKMELSTRESWGSCGQNVSLQLFDWPRQCLC